MLSAFTTFSPVLNARNSNIDVYELYYPWLLGGTPSIFCCIVQGAKASTKACPVLAMTFWPR